MTYQELQLKVRGTCTHTVELQKDGQPRLGIYNGLANWGEVYGYQNGANVYDGLFEVESLQTEWQEDESDPEGGYCPHFTAKDFVGFGYQLA